jgi:tetratricopeptide (TPR) repeat protein
MADDVEELLVRAVPRLGRDDPQTAKVRAKLVAMAFGVWERGPARLAKLGVKVEETPPLPEGSEAKRLLALRKALGSGRFVALFQALKDELARAVAEKKASGSSKAASGVQKTSGRVKRAGSGRAPKAKSASGEHKLTMSSHSTDGSGSGSGSSVSLAVPEDEPLKLAGEEAAPKPLGIRFDDEPPPEPTIELLVEEAPEAAKKEAEPEPDDDRPEQAAERALHRYRQRGDPDDLTSARRLFAEATKAAETRIEKGAARAGVALVLLLAGEVEKAVQQAEKALQAFAGEPRAIEVILRAARQGEADRLRVEAALARARAGLVEDDRAGFAAAVKELETLGPREPFAPLVKLAAWQSAGGREGDPEALIADAWARYPAGAGLADLPLGAAIERPVVLACLNWVRQRIEREGGDVLAQTVKDVEKKENVVSGAVQLALGVARSALATRAKLEKHDEQELRKWVGQALLCAQYYDHAKEALGQARSVDRNDPQVLEINKDETLCGVMRRAFDKPGVKARMGTLDGVGAMTFRKAVAARLQQVLAQRDEALSGYEKDEAAAASALARDPTRRAALAARAKAHGVPDPLVRLAAVDEESAKLASEAAALSAGQEQPAEAPGKLFGRMKAGLTKAFDKAKAAAKSAELSLKKGVADSKRAEALRALSKALRDRPEGGWGDEPLDQVLDRWDAIAARVAFLDEEAEELRRTAERAGTA